MVRVPGRRPCAVRRLEPLALLSQRAAWPMLASAMLTSALLASALAGAGCSRPATQLVVVVESDLAVPAEVVSVRARVRPLEAAVAREPYTFALTGEGSVALPFSFGVVPPDGDARRRVELAVDALDAAGEVVVTRLVRTGFLRDQSLRVPIFLASSCRDVVCAPDLSCDRGECVPAEVAPETLVPITPGEELADAGPAADAARRDAGPPSSCTPVATQPWLTLSETPAGSDLAWRAGTRPEWVVAIGGGSGLRVHAIGEDGTGDREITRALGTSWRTSDLALVPLASPEEALVIREGAPVVEVRGTLLTEGGGRSDRLLADGLSFLDVASMRGMPVMLSDEAPMPPNRPAALFAIPPTGLATRVGPIDLGTTSLAYRGSLATRGDGSLLVGRAAVGACEVVPVSSAGATGSVASFPVPGTCLAPAMTELTDGRIAIVTASTELFVVLLVGADLVRVDAMRDLGALTSAASAVVPLPGGRLRLFWPSPSGIATAPLAGDALLTQGETTTIGGPGARWAGIAHHDRATAVVHVEASTLMLTVLCD
jgi:hypothetical protein